MRLIPALLLISVIVIATIAFYPTEGTLSNREHVAVPLILLGSVGFGNEEFKMTEHFNPPMKNLEKQRTSENISISSKSILVSPIHDSLTIDYSISIFRHGLNEILPGPSGGIHISIPPNNSYNSRISVSGRTSFEYITIKEEIPSNGMRIGQTGINGYEGLNGSAVYNLTLQYHNNSFNLYLPGYVLVYGSLVQMSILVKMIGGGYDIEYSFPVNDGNFSFTLNQVLSSSVDVSDYIMQEYQISGFQTTIVRDFVSNLISISIGGLIFALLLVGLFLYYKKK